MMKWLVSAFKKPKTTKEGVADIATISDEPYDGNIYSFETKPYTSFSSTKTNRHAAFKVLCVNETLIVIAVLDGIWTSRPILKDVESTGILFEQKPDQVAHLLNKTLGPRTRPAVFGLLKEWWNPDGLINLTIIGNKRVTPEEVTHANLVTGHGIGSRTAGFGVIDMTAEGEWRWANDRSAFEAEIEKRNIENAEIRKAKEDRYRNRLNKLTWEVLLNETPFQRWSNSPPSPSKEFTKNARRKIHEVCRELSELEGKPKKGDVRKILKECVEWFNKANENVGGTIETEEREDICSALEEIVFVTKQKSLLNEIDQWREW